MRRTGIETSAYFKLDGYEEGFKKMREHGYDCADYQNFVNTETDFFKSDIASFEKQLISQRTSAQNAGIEIYQTHAPWRFPPHDSTPEERAERSEKMKKALYGTGVLGAKYMAIHPVMPFGHYSDPEPEKLLEINLEFFNGLIGTAKENGVVLCIENMPMLELSTSTPMQTLNMVKLLNSENVGMCLDTGHCWVFNLSPAEELLKFKDYVKCLHVHDNNKKFDLHTMPFFGSITESQCIDWEAFKEALKQIDESIPVSLETKVNDNLPEVIKEPFEISLSKIAKYLAE